MFQTCRMSNLSILILTILAIVGLNAHAQITNREEQKQLIFQIDSLLSLEQTRARDSSLIKTATKYAISIYPLNYSILKQQEFFLGELVNSSKYELSQAYFLYACGKLYLRIGYYNMAIGKLFSVIEMTKNGIDNELYRYAYNELSAIIVLLMLNKPDEDSKSRERFFAFTQSQIKNAGSNIEDPLLIGGYHINLGVYYVVTKKFSKAENSYRKAWQLVAHNPQKYWYMYHNGKWAEGLCMIYQGNTKKGFALVDSIKALCDDRSDYAKNYLRDIIGFRLSDYYLTTGNYDLALAENLEAKSRNDLLNINFFTHFINQNFYKIYKAKKDYKKALFYYEKIIKFNETLEQNNTKEFYKIWANKEDNIQKDNKIKSLELKTLLQDKSEQKTLRNSLVFGLISVTFFTLYILRINKKLKATNSSLERKNQEIESALLKGQHIERKRVAGELHDTLSIKLSALKWRLEAIEEKFLNKNRGEIEYAIKSLEELYTDVRFISHNLLPEELGQKGLRKALVTLVEKLNNLNKTQFHVVFDGFNCVLEQMIQYEIYNVTLELCNNVLKHAHAANAYISLSEINESLFLTVVDDGKGFQLKQKKDGFRSIKSRIESLGGSIEVKSGNKGTIVEVKV